MVSLNDVQQVNSQVPTLWSIGAHLPSVVEANTVRAYNR